MAPFDLSDFLSTFPSDVALRFDKRLVTPGFRLEENENNPFLCFLVVERRNRL